MNKKEQAEFERLQTELAFRWPTEPEPTRVPIETIGDIFAGWDFNLYSTEVYECWTTKINHGRGKYVRGSFASRDPNPIYLTRQQAHTALRWAMCRDFAKKLHHIDERIKGNG